MGESILQYGGSLAALILLVLITWGLQLGGKAEIVDEAEARALADSALCGFKAEDVTLDRGGRGALLRDADGKIMLLAPHGNRFIGRLLGQYAQSRLENGKLIILTGERFLAAVTLDLPDGAAWCAAIGGVD